MNCKIYQAKRIIFSLVGLIILSISSPYYAQENKYSELSLGLQNYNNLGSNSYSNDIQRKYYKFNTLLNYKDLSLKFALNKIGTAKINYDRSNIKYAYGKATLGFGAIDRQWSFSPNSSLILSKNARPPKSLYYKYSTDRHSSIPLLSYIGPWSFEVINAFPEVDNGPNKSMLFGARTIFKPIENLAFELIQTTQWGGNGKQNGLKGLVAAISNESNDGKYDYMNRMAGIGFSYSIPFNKNVFRIYGQAIGEDEAGGLPYCFIHLIGVEYVGILFKKATTLGFESIDTRIDETQHGFCGPNTAYNNGGYSYTNHGNVIGAPIDSEGTSLMLSGTLQLNNLLSFRYSLNHLVINDANYSKHRLSSSRKNGTINTASINFQKNENVGFNFDLSYSDIILDKSNISEGMGFGISASFKF